VVLVRSVVCGGGGGVSTVKHVFCTIITSRFESVTLTYKRCAYLYI
jgi:hypothetical protein